jgi:protein-disulfide isomerase
MKKQDNIITFSTQSFLLLLLGFSLCSIGGIFFVYQSLETKLLSHLEKSSPQSSQYVTRQEIENILAKIVIQKHAPLSQRKQNNTSASQAYIPKQTPDDHVRGNSKSDIVIIEYSDFECPYCQVMHDTLKDLALEGEILWIYRHLPLSIHKGAYEKAHMSECVNDIKGNDAFWVTTDFFFINNQMVPSHLLTLLPKIGISKQAFNSCMETSSIQEKIAQYAQQTQKAEIDGTPGNIIYNKKTGASKTISGIISKEEILEIIEEIS